MILPPAAAAKLSRFVQDAAGRLSTAEEIGRQLQPLMFELGQLEEDFRLAGYQLPVRRGDGTWWSAPPLVTISAGRVRQYCALADRIDALKALQSQAWRDWEAARAFAGRLSSFANSV